MERMGKVFKPKVSGAWHLHEASKAPMPGWNRSLMWVACVTRAPPKDLGLASFVGFSSVSALIGLSRGTSYSASNAYLDGLGLWRHAAGLAFSSVQWGPVAEVGMASKDPPRLLDLGWAS